MSGFQRPEAGKGGGDNTPIESLGKGKFKARLVGVVSLGLFQDTHKGKVKKPAEKMSLLVEVIGKTVELGDETVPRTMWVNPFNYWELLTGKGNELKWYLAFDEMAEEDDVPDWEAMLGKAIYIVNKPNDKGYDDIESLVSMDEEVAANLPPAETELFIDDAESVKDKLFGLAKYQYEQPHYEAEATSAQSAQGTIMGDALSDTDDNPY